MANDDLFIMSKGSKPGNTPSLANQNIYYDTPTNPLVICDDDLTADTWVACYEIRKDNSLCKNGKLNATGVLVDGTVSSGTSITVDTLDPRLHFKVGHHVYKDDGTFIGTIASMQYGTPTSSHWGITFESSIAVACPNNHNLHTAEGVSNSNSYNILNRILPNTASTSELYLENLENTPGYRITNAIFQSDGATIQHGASVSSFNLTTDDYFVMINSDNPLTHHFAKLTAITTSDILGDSFEFSPKYGSEISKGTKFTIWKGPEVTDTSVVAVSYGLYGNAITYASDDDDSDGAGGATDARHAGMTYVSEPLFYFYNDRLNKKGQLDHNTKYMLYYSRSDDGTDTHHNRCFLTCQDYGLKVIDYGPHTMNATLVDKMRDYDIITTGGYASDYLDGSYSSGSNSYAVDVEDWDKCFMNNRRQSENLTGEKFKTDSAYVPEGSFTGPTRYIHYDTSPDKNNIIPEVIELEVFDSINESGSYVDMRIVDPKRIYGKKIKEFDKIKIKKLIGTGNLGNNFTGLLPGTWTGTSGTTILTVTLDNEGQDLRVLLKNGSSYEKIQIGNYIYRITDIAAPVAADSKQIVTIDIYRDSDDAYWSAGNADLAENIVSQLAYRKPWSKICENLIVDFTIDTSVTYTNAGLTTQTDTIIYGDISTASADSSSSGSRLYNSEIVISGGAQTGLVFKIDYGDNNHNIIKLKTPRLQMYRDESAGESNFLDYFAGRYSVYNMVFVGEVETFENYIEDGMLKYHIAGRNKINKLLGPIVNKDYNHSDDIIYSTIGPVEKITALSFSSYTADVTNNMVGDNTLITTGTISGVSVGDLLFSFEGYFIGRIKDLTGGITLEEGTLITLYDRVATDATQILYVISSDKNNISFAKAMSKNTVTTNAVSSLMGASDKGLVFTSGNKLTDDSFGRPNIESTTLVGTSSSTKSNALGYYLNLPNSIGIGDSFFSYIKDEIDSLNIEKHTVNSLTEYEVVSIDSGKDVTLIEVAPNCPIVMGRIDKNPADTTLETLTISVYKFNASYSEGEYGALKVLGETAGIYTALNNKHIYLSDGTYLGKVLGVEINTSNDFTDATCDYNNDPTITMDSTSALTVRLGVYGADIPDGAYISSITNATTFELSASTTGGSKSNQTLTFAYTDITLDRQLPQAVTSSDYLYTSTEKTHGLYLINTQGLRSGGVLQLVNPELSSEGKPIMYNAALDTNYNGNLNYQDLSYRHGGFTYRYLNLQKTNKGGLYYNKFRLDTGESSTIYSKKKGEFNAYAPSYKIIQGIKTTPTINNMNTNNDYTNSYEKQGSPETRGILSASGGNFADHNIYPTGNLNVDYDLLPKFKSATQGGPWNTTLTGGSYGAAANASNEIILGIKNNAISHIKDSLEIIDPKTITPFLFSPADMWPDSMTREHHIGNISRNFTNYNIMLKSEPKLLKSNIKHRHYLGSGNYLEENNSSYETLNISSSSINTNEMKRFGLMRLIECTYDWHFNLVDPENPPSEKDLVNVFTYDRYQKVIASGMYVQSGGYATSDTVITTKDAASGGSAANPSTAFAQNGVYDSSGNNIGFVSSVSSTTITLAAAAKKPNGSLYTGQLYHLNDAAIGHTSNYTNYSYPISGRGGKASFMKVNKSSIGRADSNIATNALQLHMLQSAIFNGKGDDVDDGYGQGTGNEFDHYFEGKFDAAFSDDRAVGRCHHICLPPVFKGFELIRITTGSAGDVSCKVAVVAGVTTFIQYTVSTDPVSITIVAGDKIYTENGEFIGVIDDPEDFRGGSHAFMEFTTPIKCDVAIDSPLYKGGHTAGSYDIAALSANEGGFHPLAQRSEIAHYGTPTNNYSHPSRVLEALQYDVPIRGKATNVKEFFEPVSVTGTTYAAVNSNPDTITSSANNFITAGFEKGMVILVSGSSESGNNVTHIINTVVAGTLTLTAASSLTVDAAGDTWTITAITGGSVGEGVYSSLRAIALGRFKIEMTSDVKMDIGSSTVCATKYTTTYLDRKMGNKYESTDSVYKPSLYMINTPHQIFAYYKLTEKAASPYFQLNEGHDGSGDQLPDEGVNIADGINVVFKPLLRTTAADGVTHNLGYISPNGQTDLAQLIIDVSDVDMHKWLEFVPNLTGCYLVSNDGPRIGDSTILTSSNFAGSIESRYPSKIHNIISHTIRTDAYPSGSGAVFNHHVLLIDNCDAADEISVTYRVMRPANVCVWPDSATEIDLYKMSSRYTKKPNSKKMYEDIGAVSYYEDGFLKGDSSQDDYNEGIQSMYVVVNPDHTSTSNRFLVPRNTNGNHLSELFGNGKTFNNNSYDMLVNDGIEKQRRNITIVTNVKTISSTDYNYTTLDYGQQFPEKMSGVVSLGEIFTLTSNQESKLKNVKTASIGSTVTICSEAEDIINDVLEDNNIVYTNTTIDYPYFTAPNIQGADVYNTIKFLSGLKNKEIHIDKEEIKLLSSNSSVRYTGIEINQTDSDVSVIEIAQNKSAFDIYNEVIIYGKGVKSIKRNNTSIRTIGKKTLEEFDSNLSTQTEVDSKASKLLQFYNASDRRVTVKLAGTKLEWLKSGDIITIDYPDENIPRNKYIVFEVRHTTVGTLEIEAGAYTKTLDSRLAELIVQQKKMASFLRSDRFKSPAVDNSFFEKTKLKPIRLTVSKVTTAGHTPLGLTTLLAFTTILKAGTKTTTELIDEDLI